MRQNEHINGLTTYEVSRKIVGCNLDIDIDVELDNPIAADLKNEPSVHELGDFLGNGRSAVVYKCRRDGQDVARKIFCGTDLTNLILTVFYGSPVDYKWSEAAIATAFHRRKVLKGLLKFWFGDEITIADSVTTGVHAETNEQYMDTEFIKGRVAALYNPFVEEKLSEFTDLKYKVLPKLQGELMKSGMDGTVWQAGYGQPCAIPNFLYSDDLKKWIWIDAESGVPAIVSYNIRKLISYYIPKAFKFGRVMFDSLDCESFKTYIEQNTTAIKETLSEDEFTEFSNSCDGLIESSLQWQNTTRSERSRGYFLFADKITEEQHEYYAKHSVLWLLFLMRWFISHDFPKLFTHLVQKIGKYAARLNPVKLITFCCKSLISGDYRIETAHNHIERKIETWHDKHRLSDDQAKILHEELDDNSARKYLSDFGVFLMFKPLGYIIRGIVAVMLTQGMVSNTTAVFIFSFISIILRTSYSLFRCFEDIIARKEISWVALLISPLPMVGTLAHPCQMLHSARRGHSISQFIIYEILSAISSKIPIFGGHESEIEFQLNRLGFSLVKFSEKK